MASRYGSGLTYVYQLECYTGKQESTVEVGLGRNVVTRLTWDLEGQHYTVYMDNIFRSVPLFQRPMDNGIYATGAMIADSAITGFERNE